MVKKAAAGDKIALEELLYRNYSILYGYILKLTQNEDAAGDITQETMVRAIVNIKSFKGKSKFSTYLVAIASNLYKDSLKRKRNMADYCDYITLADNTDVEETVINKDNMNRVKMELKGLDPEKRMTFILKHFYNYSYEEIAGIMKCPVGTVRSRLYYCIRKLRDSLAFI